MKETRAIIETLSRINAAYQYLEIAVEEQSLFKIKPGQSLLVRPIDPENHIESWEPYLRDQWWPVPTKTAPVLRIERANDHRYAVQQTVSVIGPVGEPYRFRKSLRSVALIAYDTAPTPMLTMVGQLINNDVDVTLVLLGSARDYQTKHLPEQLEVKLGLDDLNWPDMVTTLGWADQIFVTVSQDDERQRFGEVLRTVQERRNDVPNNYIFGVSQPLLPCGTGACSACLQRVDNQLVAACTHGPAFDLTLMQLPK